MQLLLLMGDENQAYLTAASQARFAARAVHSIEEAQTSARELNIDAIVMRPTPRALAFRELLRDLHARSPNAIVFVVRSDPPVSRQEPFVRALEEATPTDVLLAVAQGLGAGGDPLFTRFETVAQLAPRRSWVTSLARERSSGRVFVLSTLEETIDAEEHAALLEDARPALATKSPRLATVMESGLEGARPMILAQVEPGATLSAWQKQIGPLPLLEALAVGAAVAEGLSALHGMGAVHGALDAELVWIEARGGVRLLGSEMGAFAESLRRRTRYGPGVLPFREPTAPPEDATGDRPTIRGDIYRLAAMLARALTGKFPIEDLVDQRPDLPVELARALHQSLARPPTARPARVDEMLAAMTPHLPRAPGGIARLFGRRDDPSQILAGALERSGVRTLG